MTSVFRPLTSIRTLTPFLGCGSHATPAEPARQPPPRVSGASEGQRPVTRSAPPESERGRAGTKRGARGEHVVDQQRTLRAARTSRERAAGRPRRSARGRPTWRRPCERRRHLETLAPSGSPATRRSPRPGSNPLQRRRHGAGGTGTITPASSSGGALLAIARAARRARATRGPNLSADTSARAAPSYGAADQAWSTPGIAASRGRSRLSRDSQRSHSCARHRAAAPAQRRSAAARPDRAARRASRPTMRSRVGPLAHELRRISPLAGTKPSGSGSQWRRRADRPDFGLRAWPHRAPDRHGRPGSKGPRCGPIARPPPSTRCPRALRPAAARCSRTASSSSQPIRVRLNSSPP